MKVNLGALERLENALIRADTEEPRLAAPNGTVTVPIEDLRWIVTTLATHVQRFSEVIDDLDAIQSKALDLVNRIYGEM